MSRHKNQKKSILSICYGVVLGLGRVVENQNIQSKSTMILNAWLYNYCKSVEKNGYSRIFSVDLKKKG